MRSCVCAYIAIYVCTIPEEPLRIYRCSQTAHPTGLDKTRHDAGTAIGHRANPQADPRAHPATSNRKVEPQGPEHNCEQLTRVSPAARAPFPHALSQPARPTIEGYSGLAPWRDKRQGQRAIIRGNLRCCTAGEVPEVSQQRFVTSPRTEVPRTETVDRGIAARFIVSYIEQCGCNGTVCAPIACCWDTICITPFVSLLLYW